MFGIQLAEQRNALIVVELLKNVSEIDGVDFGEFFLQYIELHVATEGTDVFRKLLHIAPGNCLILDCGGKTADEIRDRLQSYTTQEGGTRAVHVGDKQFSVARSEFYVIDDLDFIIVAIEDFLIQQVVLEADLALGR